MQAEIQVPRRLGRRPVLDGVRGVAVLLVIALHVGLISRGYIGVDIFLALSGFLITALLCEEWEESGQVSLRRFYVRRVRRLLPALLAVLSAFAAVVLLLHPWAGLWPLGKLIGSTLLCVNNWVSTFAAGHSQVLGALSPTWTLGQEVQFYLLWPPILLILLRARVRPALLVALLALVVTGLICAVPFVSHAAPNYNAYTSPLDRGAELLVGAGAAIAWRNRWLEGPLCAALTRWLLAGGLLYLLISSRVPERWAYLSAAVLGALLIVNLIAGDQGILERALGSRPARYTGKISYGLYLYHLPIYYLVWEWMPGHSPYVYAPIVFACAFAAAGLSWRLLESPVLRGRLKPRRLRLRLRLEGTQHPAVRPGAGR